NIASTNGIDAQYGGDFSTAPSTMSKVLVFDPASTSTVRNVNLVAGAAGMNNLAGNTTWGAGSTLIVDPGTTTGGAFNISRTGGAIAGGSGATLQITQAATFNFGGAADALNDGINRVNVVNNLNTTLHVTAGSKTIGTLDGSGNTNIDPGTTLSAARFS